MDGTIIGAGSMSGFDVSHCDGRMVRQKVVGADGENVRGPAASQCPSFARIWRETTKAGKAAVVPSHSWGKAEEMAVQAMEPAREPRSSE